MAIKIETQTSKIETSWTTTFLVSGTCIGGGMLALPIQTAHCGFLPSFIALFIVWAFMTFTGLLLVEATLWIKNETHFASLSRLLLGRGAKLIAIVVYLFMNYASLVAYTAGGANLFINWGKVFFGVNLGYETACILFSVFFGSLIYLGVSVVEKINFIFMVSLVLTYLGLVSFGIGNLNLSYLIPHAIATEHFGIFSMILATFSYQMIVPSLCFQSGYNPQSLRKSVMIGTLIPFVFYSIWLLVIHGIVPLDGPDGLAKALSDGVSATQPLRIYFPYAAFAVLSDFFGLFAILTSYLGLSLALFFFLKDCFKELQMNMSKNSIILTSLIPTLLLAIMFPKALIKGLDISGGYGDTILSGLLPISMIWVGRYHMKIKGDYQVMGGKPFLILAAIFYASILIFQFF